jgi:hypothetical protein
MTADPILSDLEFMLETRQELDVLNYHKGFPINCKAQVTKINHDQVTFKVQAPGSVCLESQEQTILLSRGLPEAVHARILSFDLLKEEVVLADFAYVGERFGERMIARVQPEDPIIVGIEADSVPSTGTLLDVSLNGVGVMVDIPDFERGQTLQLTLPLPAGEITLPGKVLNVVETTPMRWRLSIGFTRNAQEIAIVMRYIKERRAEILAEIEQLYQKVYQEKLSLSEDRPD